MRIRAGKLARIITIQSYTYTLTPAGSPIYTWEHKATLRAELIQRDTTEYLRAYGAADETVVVFRTRWIDGVTPADRVVFDGMNMNLREVVPLDRRAGLELRCTALA